MKLKIKLSEESNPHFDWIGADQLILTHANSYFVVDLSSKAELRKASPLLKVGL